MEQPHRQFDRDRTRMRATLVVGHRAFSASVMDLCETGLCLYVREETGAAPGLPVTVVTEEMGSLDGTVRWVRPPQLGLELHLSSNNRAKVESFYKYFAATHIRA